MILKDLIEQLSIFPPDTEVIISDGYKCNFYSGDYEILPYVEDDKLFVDIGIGGLDG